jgi:hypothetical protein
LVAGEVFDGLRLAGLMEIGNAELGDSANRAAEGATRHDAVEMFGSLLGHDFHLEYARTPSQAKTEPQEFNFRVPDNFGSCLAQELELKSALSAERGQIGVSGKSAGKSDM